MFAIYLRSKVPAEVSLAKGSLISMVVLIERFQGKEEVYNTKVYERPLVNDYVWLIIVRYTASRSD